VASYRYIKGTHLIVLVLWELISETFICSEMNAMEVGPSPGGFLPPSIPSPPVSIVSSLHIIGKQRPLPVPRPTPLKPGSKHETALVRFLDDGLLDISRKYTKKYTPGGYYDIQPMVQDLERLVDLIWISATREFTIP